jgi:hypothetical protein
MSHSSYLRDPPLGAFDVPRIQRISSLGSAPGALVVVKSSDGVRNIKEMVVLCSECIAHMISLQATP